MSACRNCGTEHELGGDQNAPLDLMILSGHGAMHMRAPTQSIDGASQSAPSALTLLDQAVHVKRTLHQAGDCAPALRNLCQS
jgi:hypothetical protein